MLTPEQLKELSKPFPDDILHLKVQSFYPKGSTPQNAERALWVTYLQHTDVAKRIESVDPSYEFKINSRWEKNEMKYVEGILIISGVERTNVGEGENWKDAYSDCLKRCAMLFGIGRYLYDSENIWTEWKPEFYYKKLHLKDLSLIRGQADKTDTSEEKCEACGVKITPNVANFSRSNYKGMIYCIPCQKTHGEQPLS